MRRTLICSDMHCGHHVGLTPPSKFVSRNSALGRTQRRLWDAYCAVVDGDNIDIMAIDGDLIDGSGTKSGGVEQLTTDRQEQAEMAVECIKYAKPKKVVVIAGTPHHVGHAEDWEKVIANELGAHFAGQEWIDIDGVIFNLKHKVGASSIPHGRHTAIARDKMWEMFWNIAEGYPDSDVIIRGHVHYHITCGGIYHKKWLGMTLPALQGKGSKYGTRQCSGLVHFGGVDFWTEKGRFSWEANVKVVKTGSAKPLVL